MNTEEIKYNCLLKYVNGILENIKKPKIEKLEDFKDIDRLDIISDTSTKLFHDMSPELFKKGVFDKKKCGYYTKTDNISLNCLRGMLKDMNYDFTFVQREVIRIFEGEKYRKSHSFYSIKNKTA